MDLEEFIRKIDRRQMIAVPAAVLALSIIILAATYFTTGSPVRMGIEFTGGTLITVPADEPESQVLDKLAGYDVTELRRVGSRYYIQLPSMESEDYTGLARTVNEKFTDAEIRYIGPVYSKQLQRDAPRYLLMSFILMALVVFFVFRQPVISGIVVLCALADIIIAAGMMTAVGVKLSLGTVAALLMLIGYSVDTDILLTVRVLKRRGPVNEKMLGAMRTGLMMTSTTISAVIVLILVSSIIYLVSPTFTKIDVISDISVVLFFGLLADMMNTWITNVQALRWYLQRNPKLARGGKR